MLPATEWRLWENSQIYCYNYDFDEERRTALDECGHGYVPLSHSGTRHDEHWTNNNLMKRDTFIFCKLVWVIEK